MTRQLAIAITAIAFIACSKNTATDASHEEDFAAKGVMPASAPPVISQDMAPLAKLQSANGRVEAVVASGQASAPMEQALPAGTSQEITPSMIIRTGQAAIEVEGLDPAVVKLRQLASQMGGYVANSSFSGGRDQVKTAMLELKIPAAKYDQAVGGLNGIGKLESINTSAEDVGEEYVDVAAREANAKRLEERLVTLLSTRTGKLEDVLAVERELARGDREIRWADAVSENPLGNQHVVCHAARALPDPRPHSRRKPARGSRASGVEKLRCARRRLHCFTRNSDSSCCSCCNRVGRISSCFETAEKRDCHLTTIAQIND